MRPKGTSAELEWRRRRALAALDEGLSPTTVARVLGCARSALYRWKGLARQGPDGLAPRPSRRHAPRLDDDQLHRLEELLRPGARAHGWPNELWTAARVNEVIRRHFDTSFDLGHLRRLLRARLNWSCQKPQRQARERDEDEVARWKREEFPRIARDAQERSAHLVFLDESGFQLTPVVRRSWAPRGQTPILEAWDRRDRISAISCITLSPKAHRPNLYFRLLPDNTNVHGEDVTAYLKQLRSELAGPMTVVWDRHTIHSRSRAVRRWLARHPEVVVEDFPGYIPELNPEEYVWAWLKYGRLSNLAAWDTDELRDRLIDGLVDAKYDRDLLRSFIGHSNLPLRL